MDDLVKGVGVLMFKGGYLVWCSSRLCLVRQLYNSRYCSWSCNGTFYVVVCICGAESSTG